MSQEKRSETAWALNAGAAERKMDMFPEKRRKKKS